MSKRWNPAAIGWCGILLCSPCACSSARLDPNTGAFTLSRAASPAPSGSGAPTGRASPNVPAAAPQHEASGTPKATVIDARHKEDVNQTGAGGSPNEISKPKPPACSNLPDPTPTRTDRWIDAVVRLDRGKLDLASWAPLRTRRAEVTPRKMGRFAAELWIGCELIDRVRFDFPLVGADTSKRTAHDPNFESAGSFQLRIRLPDSDRATRLELIDRAGERREILDWPLRPAVPVAP